MFGLREEHIIVPFAQVPVHGIGGLSLLVEGFPLLCQIASMYSQGEQLVSGRS